MKVEDAFTQLMQEQFGFTPLWVGGEPKHPFEFDPDEESPSIEREWSMFRAGFAAAQPPEGYPSWEDWLASYGYQIGYASTIDCWILHKPSGNSMQYDDYSSALAAAKKEAQ